MQQSVGVNTGGNAIMRIESLPFSAIPGQSRLFVQYQTDPISLKKYYPSAIASHSEIAHRIPEVLRNYKTDRELLCNALARMNSDYGAAPKVLENIERLKRHDTVAVVTGQQAGFLTGPLYTIYKALSAVREAEYLRQRGFNAVPVFWAATEDHDFEEIASVTILNKENELSEFKLGTDSSGSPVGNIELRSDARETIDIIIDELPETEFSALLHDELIDAWQPGESIGTSFAKHISRMLGKYGLIVIDPLDESIKRLCAPIYVEAVRKSEVIVKALTSRSMELEADGFQAQVLIEDDYFPLFRHNGQGERKALRKTDKGTFRSAGERTEFTIEELVDDAAETPERFSPGVMLRPVVQDFLLPTVCYFGGGAEIAYFAQNSEVYRILERPVTPILHRQSFTVIEAKHARTLEKYGLEFADILGGRESVIPRIVDQHLNPSTASVFADVEEKINIELNRLDQELSQIDPTLAANLATRRRKILYHIGAMHGKFRKTAIRNDKTVKRQLDGAFDSLTPDGGLQERTLNVLSYLDRYGPYFLDWIADSIDLEDKGHRVLYL